MRTLLFFLTLFPSILFSQESAMIERMSKKSQFWITERDGLFGLSSKTAVIEAPVFAEYFLSDGLVVFYGNESNVCYDSKGTKIVTLTGGNLAINEISNFIIGVKKEQTTLYNLQGKQLFPFDKYSFDPYEKGVIVKRENPVEYALFDALGNAIVNFGPHEIYYDDYMDIVGVKYDSLYTVHPSKNMTLPNNCSLFNEKTFVSNREVSVGEYINFIGSQRIEGALYDQSTYEPIDVRALLPDTNQMEKKLMPLFRYILPLLTSDEVTEHDAFVDLADEIADIYVPFEIPKAMRNLLDYPITGVTKHQAEQYCNWLEYQYQNHEMNDNFSYVDFNLPTEEQWESFATQGLRPQNLEKLAPDSLNAENCMMLIYNSSIHCKNYPGYLKASLGGGSAQVNARLYDMQGRVHIFGNVAEMTTKEGVSKGGSYFHPASEATVKATLNYSGPKPWLGFRIVGQYKL